MSISRRRARRLTRTLLVGIVVLGLAHAMAAWGDDDDRHATSSAVGPTLPTPRALFADQLIVEGIHGFSTAEAARIGAATGVRPLTITDGELYVVHGSGTYNELPLATMVADASAYGKATGSTSIGRAMAHGVVVAASTARMFGLRVGTRMRIARGASVPVTAVVADALIGGYQLATGRGVPTGL